VPFRKAHEIVGRIVREAEALGRSLSELSLAELQAFAPEFEASAVGLKADDIVSARQVQGGPAPEQVRIQLQRAAERIESNRAWITEFAARLPTLEGVTRGSA
jgi:argininosuccinate lyase